MKFLIKFPTRQRPEKFKTTFAKYYKYLSGNHDYEFRVTIDDDDPSMHTSEITSFLDRPYVKVYSGRHKTKIEAVNDDMEDGQWDICLLASDDMIPQVKHYDHVIASLMQRHYPNLDGCLHFNDGRVGRRLNTLSIMGYKLYQRFGYIYHPDYVSVWCDNEFHDVTKKWKKTKYIDKVIIKHAWVNHTGKDALHKRNESFFARDKMVYFKRKRAGFPKKRITK